MALTSIALSLIFSLSLAQITHIRPTTPAMRTPIQLKRATMPRMPPAGLRPGGRPSEARRARGRQQVIKAAEFQEIALSTCT
eukprot:496998-Amorphochlora_amoeboformis.AAC.2